MQSYIRTFFSVHPCEKKEKGGCEEKCVKGVGLKFTCACPQEGFELDTDGKSCKFSKISSYLRYKSFSTKYIEVQSIAIRSAYLS